jgi:hypothetical protein
MAGLHQRERVVNEHARPGPGCSTDFLHALAAWWWSHGRCCSEPRDVALSVADFLFTSFFHLPEAPRRGEISVRAGPWFTVPAEHGAQIELVIRIRPYPVLAQMQVMCHMRLGCGDVALFQRFQHGLVFIEGAGVVARRLRLGISVVRETSLRSVSTSNALPVSSASARWNWAESLIQRGRSPLR